MLKRRILSIRPGLVNIMTIIFLLFCSGKGNAQSSIFFYQLNTSHGLSGNYINDMCFDKGGNLWIGTTDGLNMFNGKTVVRYFNEEHPQLRDNHVTQVVCDDRNRIWVVTSFRHLTLIDENRKFHRIAFYGKDGLDRIRWVLPTKESGMVVYLRKGLFYLNKKDILK